MMHKSAMISRLTFLPFAVALTALAGCTQFPALDRTITPALEAADYPTLEPLEPLLARTTARRADSGLVQAQLNARVVALQARAARLRGSVLSGRERQRLSNGLQ